MPWNYQNNMTQENLTHKNKNIIKIEKNPPLSHTFFISFSGHCWIAFSNLSFLNLYTPETFNRWTILLRSSFSKP